MSIPNELRSLGSRNKGSILTKLSDNLRMSQKKMILLSTRLISENTSEMIGYTSTQVRDEDEIQVADKVTIMSQIK